MRFWLYISPIFCGDGVVSDYSKDNQVVESETDRGPHPTGNFSWHLKREVTVLHLLKGYPQYIPLPALQLKERNPASFVFIPSDVCFNRQNFDDADHPSHGLTCNRINTVSLYVSWITPPDAS